MEVTQSLYIQNNRYQEGRNNACQCGSGKKYKQCCGDLSDKE
ncbi:SEC-C metal-binding domain-containing protein [Candidatus Erwinia haradaeae]